MKGKKLISVGFVSKFLIFPFLCPLFYIIRDFAFKQLHFALKFTNHPLIVSAIMFISEMMSGIFEVVRKSRSKAQYEKMEPDDPKKSKNLEIYYNELIDKTKKIEEKLKEISKWTILNYIFLTALIDCICYTAISILCISNLVEEYNIHIQMRMTPIFFMSFLSKLIFKEPFYNHQKVSICIVGVGFILILCRNYMDIHFQGIFYYIGFIITQIIYSFKQLLDKYMMDKLYLSAFLILFYQGLVGLIISFILIGIASFIPCYKEWDFCEGNYVETFSNFADIYSEEFSQFLYVGLLLISSMFLNILLMLTKKYFTATHRSVADTLNAFCSWVLLLCSSKNPIGWTIKNILDIIGYIVMLLGCLIYNEIIILHVFRLDEGTKYSIMTRGDNESKAILKDCDILEPIAKEKEIENNVSI